MIIKTPCENEYSFMILTESSFPPCLKSFVKHPPEVVMGLTNCVPYRTLRSTGMQVVRNERGLPSRKVEEKSFHRLIITDVVQVNVHFTPQQLTVNVLIFTTKREDEVIIQTITLTTCMYRLQGSHSDSKTSNNGKAFSSQGIFNRLEKSGKITQNTEKVREFQTCYLLFFSDM